MKNKSVTVRFTEEEYNTLVENADSNGLTISDFIRERTCYKCDDEEESNWISKKIVLRRISSIQRILDKYETTNKKIVKLIKKEVSKLWKYL